MQNGTFGILAPVGVGNLRFRPGVAGARTRTAQAKLREIFSVKDFGAVGDGLTDDTKACQAAINAAVAFAVKVSSGATGFIVGEVFFPLGNYSVSGLTLSEGIRLYGDGIGQTFLSLRNGSNTSLITHTIAGTGAGPTNNFFQQFVIEDMTLYGNKTNQSGTSHAILIAGTAWTITTSYAVAGFIRRVQIYAALNAGISIGVNRNWGQISDVVIKDCGDKGVLNAAYDWRIYNIDIGSCLYGYSQDAAGGATIWGANIYLCTEAGINISAGVNTYLWFTGCSIDLNSKYGAVVDGNSDQETFMVSFDACRFMGNSSLTNNTYADIFVNNCHGLAVSNCQFYAQGANRPPYLVQTGGTCGPVLWNNNHYRTSGGTQPYATAITNDFIKLAVAGDRQASIFKTANGGLDVKGTVTNDSAAAGMIGEFVTANATAVALVTATAKTITSISLTAGDWDVSGFVETTPAGLTTQSQLRVSISLVNNADDFSAITLLQAAFPVNTIQAVPTPTARISISATTTVYLVANITFASSTLTAKATIRARRAR